MKKTFCVCLGLMALCVGAVTFDCGDGMLSLDGRGRITGLRDRTAGRELVRTPLALVTVAVGGGRGTVEPVVCRECAGGRLEFAFPDTVGTLVLECQPFFGGWTFTFAEVALTNAAQSVTFGRIAPVCVKYVGRMVNGLSDETDGVVMRSYEWRPRMWVDAAHGILTASASAKELKGTRFGLVGGSRATMPRRLRAMTLATGLPHSDTGGGWALGAEGNRSSYYMLGRPTEDTIDDWIDAAVRCGSTTLHFDWWWEPHKGEGHYPVWTNLFPRGMAGLRDANLKAHAAGLKTDMHTLSGCIGFDDPWVTPHASSNLMWQYTYTLARPLGKDDTTVYVNERPGDKHDFELLYSSNGNVLRIGTELMQYKGLSRTPPYAFTGVTRGAFRTEVFPHAAGERTDYVRQHYLSFFAEPDSPLADELAACLGNVYSACGFDQVYMDGAEGVGFKDGAKTDLMLRKLFAAFAAKGNAPLWEDSQWTTHAWWFHSRIGSWDYSYFALKRFTDRHLDILLPQSRLANYLEPSLGWWSLRAGFPWAENTDCVRAIYLDEHEYFIGKTAAADAAISLRHGWGDHSKKPFEVDEMRAMTLIGWYERFRLARAFTPAVRAALAKTGADYRLRQDANGLWTLTPYTHHEHRVTGRDYAEWTVPAAAAQPAELRVAALYDIADYASPKGFTAIGADDLPAMKMSQAAGVKATFRAVTGEKGKAVRLQASNAGQPARGAWAAAEMTFPYPYTNRVFTGCGAFGCWVKGDGSGAVLNMQFRRTRPDGGGINDHIVKLDFTGWRYIAFALTREMDVEKSCDYSWPYLASGPAYALFERGHANPKRVGGLGLWVNGVPTGGSVDVEIGEIRALPAAAATYANLAVEINGVRHALPFPLRGGEFAVLADGFWTRYSLSGLPAERRPAEGPAPQVAAGTNRLRLTGGTAAGAAARAEITVMARGTAQPALVERLRKDQERILAYEAELPEMWTPAKGLDALSPVKVRPGMAARIELEIVGPIARPVLTVGSAKCAFAADVGKNEKLVMKDGRSWIVRGPCGKVRLQGTCDTALPPLRGVNALSLSSADPAHAAAQVRIVKRYDID